MFIERKHNGKPKLRRSEMLSRLRNMSLLRSFGIDLDSGFYKYFAPTALVVIAAIVFATSLINSRASGLPKGLESVESPQEQIQFPEGLDYGKFQHSSRNHSRLPCLLCHRRDSNAPIPKRPGASQHLPCAGCHAQQFSNSESPICTICHTDVKSGALKPFPHLQSFRMKFDHSRHVAIWRVSFATCHRPASQGVAMSIASGL